MTTCLKIFSPAEHRHAAGCWAKKYLLKGNIKYILVPTVYGIDIFKGDSIAAICRSRNAQNR